MRILRRALVQKYANDNLNEWRDKTRLRTVKGLEKWIQKAGDAFVVEALKRVQPLRGNSWTVGEGEDAAVTAGKLADVRKFLDAIKDCGVSGKEDWKGLRNDLGKNFKKVQAQGGKSVFLPYIQKLAAQQLAEDKKARGDFTTKAKAVLQGKSQASEAEVVKEVLRLLGEVAPIAEQYHFPDKKEIAKGETAVHDDLAPTMGQLISFLEEDSPEKGIWRKVKDTIGRLASTNKKIEDYKTIGTSGDPRYASLLERNGLKNYLDKAERRWRKP